MAKDSKCNLNVTFRIQGNRNAWIMLDYINASRRLGISTIHRETITRANILCEC